MTWKSSVNVAGQPYLYDKNKDRIYWTSDLFLIACILNHYEGNIDELESFIESHEFGEVPTMFDALIDRISNEFKSNFRSLIGRNAIKSEDGWSVKKVILFDGIEYEATLSIKEVK